MLHRTQRVLLLATLTLALTPTAAIGDSLHIGHLKWVPSAGAYRFTASATAPPDSDYAVTLARHCPSRPSEAELTSEPHVAFTQAGRESVPLLANPAVGQTGPGRVCVWLVRYDQSISARFSREVNVPADSVAPDPTSVLVNSHPWFWVPLGSLGFGLLLAAIAACVLTPIGLILLLARLRRKRIGRIREEGRQDARLDDIREQADSDSPNTPTYERPTEETAATGTHDDIGAEHVDGVDIDCDGETVIDPLAEETAEHAAPADGGDADPHEDAAEPTDGAGDAGATADTEAPSGKPAPSPERNDDPVLEPPLSDELD